ncbi:MAG: FAD-dependent oxidoreductase, partial [Armatimonadota bacterium]|nr:FAD-dependent oxidoreductase [Armatimonadota bacterium]
RKFPDVIGKLGCSYKIQKPFDVPYRILVPRNVENLLVAGRCVSVEDRVFGHGEFLFRDQGCCMVTGHAAGTAAALASRTGTTPRNLDVRMLQRRLLEQGAFLFDEEEEDRRKEVFGA